MSHDEFNQTVRGSRADDMSTYANPSGRARRQTSGLAMDAVAGETRATVRRQQRHRQNGWPGEQALEQLLGAVFRRTMAGVPIAKLKSASTGRECRFWRG